MYINPRTYNILMAIRKAAFDEYSFAMPEILRHCAVSNEDAVKIIIRRVRKGADPLPFARFFDVLYTDEDVTSFTDAFDEAAPEEYVQEDDLSGGMPWCMPWTWESAPLSAEEDDTPESLARRYVAYNYKDIKQTFRSWKEENH